MNLYITISILYCSKTCRGINIKKISLGEKYFRIGTHRDLESTERQIHRLCTVLLSIINTALGGVVCSQQADSKETAS